MKGRLVMGRRREGEEKGEGGRCSRKVGGGGEREGGRVRWGRGGKV